MMEKEESKYSLFDEIPTPIIWDILSRLPTKACLYCKLVCKDWYRIIISPEFGDERSARGCYSTLLLHGAFFELSKNFLLLDLEEPVKVDEECNLSVNRDLMISLSSNFDIKHYELRLQNECNGVICLESRIAWGPFAAWNPLTGQCVFVKQSIRLGYHPRLCGLGCCPVSRQFKVLRILERTETDDGGCEAELLTLGTNEWRRIGEAPPTDLVTGSFFEGSLHWCSDTDDCIQSFHFGDEKFSHIQLPDELSRMPHRLSTVSSFNSCLCVSDFTSSDCVIWLLKDYNVNDSWVKQYVFNEVVLGVMPMFEMDSNEKMLVSYASGKSFGFLAADIRAENHKRVSVFGSYFFSVVSCNVKFSNLQGSSRGLVKLEEC